MSIRRDDKIRSRAMRMIIDLVPVRVRARAMRRVAKRTTVRAMKHNHAGHFGAMTCDVCNPD